jgi:hypothetical protein
MKFSRTASALHRRQMRLRAVNGFFRRFAEAYALRI